MPLCDVHRRAALEHLDAALLRMQWAADELRDDAAALPLTLSLSLSERAVRVLAGDVAKLAPEPPVRIISVER